jgi:hypothetical protein
MRSAARKELAIAVLFRDCRELQVTSHRIGPKIACKDNALV